MGNNHDMRNYTETTYRHYSPWCTTAENFAAEHWTPDWYSSSYHRCQCHQYAHDPNLYTQKPPSCITLYMRMMRYYYSFRSWFSKEFQDGCCLCGSNSGIMAQSGEWVSRSLLPITSLMGGSHYRVPAEKPDVPRPYGLNKKCPTRS